MKKLALLALSGAAALFLQACAHDEPVTRTTTTEETVVKRPNSTIVETQTRSSTY